MLNDSLDQKELLYLTDAIEMENLCIAKYGVYADQCADEELKNLIFQLSKNKRQHADKIKQSLRQFNSNKNRF